MKVRKASHDTFSSYSTTKVKDEIVAHDLMQLEGKSIFRYFSNYVTLDKDRG